MNILKEAEMLLRENEYDVWRPNELDRFYFEDPSIFGMLTTYESPEELVELWDDRQEDFLRLYQHDLRSSENNEKVWNAYTVHLAVPDVREKNSAKWEDIRNKLYQIEEDFVGTRKIVRVGVGEGDVREALLPLLEIQADPKLAAGNYREDLRSELREDYEEAFLLLLDEGVPVDDIADKLLTD
jgi:hypothetical protein